MNVKFYLLSLSVVAMMSCNVDENYDLSNVKTDNIVIGTNDSVFDVPVATLTLTDEDFSNISTKSTTESMSFLEVITLVNAFLPSDTVVDIDALTSDDNRTEIDRLTEELVEELKSSDSKCMDLAEILYTYMDDIEDEPEIKAVCENLGLDVDNNPSVEDIYMAIKELVKDDELTGEFQDLLGDAVEINVVDGIKDYTNIDVEEELGTIEIPSDVVDIIKDNVDGIDSKLSIIATFEHNFPFDFDILPLTLVNDTTGDSISINLTLTGESVDPLEIDIDRLISILEDGSGARLVTTIDLKSYISGNESDYYLKIKLSLRKSGAISF